MVGGHVGNVTVSGHTGRKATPGAAGASPRSDDRVELARPEGFEPPTPWSEATCSSPLSYGRVRDRSGVSDGT